MTHLLLLASLGSALVGAPSGGSALKPAAPSPDCLDNGARFARQPVKAETMRLGELPAGSMVLTVLREENGCAKPVVVREGFGSGGERQAERQPIRDPARR